MSFLLVNFEEHLPEDIVRKGLDYFAALNVDNLARQDDTWAADVYGTDTYTVEIKIQKGEVINWFCDCPYDWGPVCKHVAAVLFAIRDEVSEIEAAEESGGGQRSARPQNTPKSGSGRRSQKASRPAADPVEEIIGRLKKEELQELLLFLARREDEVRAYLLSKYAGRLPQTSKKEFKQLVQSVIKTHRTGRYGIIDYQSSARLGDQLYKLVAEASGEWPGIYLCEEVIDQGASACREADDSSGSIGGAIDHAFSQLYDLVQTGGSASPDVAKYLFKLALSKHHEDKFDDFDWGDNFRYLATTAVREMKEAEQLIKVLEAYISDKENEKYGQYSLERAALLKLELLEKWRNPAAARQYLLDHLHLPKFRRMELENALQEKRYDDLRRLAEEGILLDTENRFPGLVAEWKQWLMRWAEVTGDRTALIELTEKMFLESGNMEYYRQLKKMIPKKNFTPKIATYIRHFEKITKKYGSAFSPHIADILEEEGRLPELMEMIAADPRLDLLDRYRKLLAKDHKRQYIQCYDQAVRSKMDWSGNRQAYRECCRYLNLLVKLGGRENVRQIITDWKATYPRRRAMLEELRRVKV